MYEQEVKWLPFQLEPQVTEKFLKWTQYKKDHDTKDERRTWLKPYVCNQWGSDSEKHSHEMRNHEGNIAGTELTFSRRNLINLSVKNQWPDLLQFVEKGKWQKIA